MKSCMTKKTTEKKNNQREGQKWIPKNTDHKSVCIVPKNSKKK